LGRFGFGRYLPFHGVQLTKEVGEAFELLTIRGGFVIKKSPRRYNPTSKPPSGAAFLYRLELGAEGRPFKTALARRRFKLKFLAFTLAPAASNNLTAALGSGIL
jgi:hypothetical protein